MASKAKVEKEDDRVRSSVPPLLLVLLAIALMVTSYLAYSFLPDRTFVVNNERLNVVLANTPSQRSKGLSGRESLPKDQGMLFAFEEASEYCFWMQDMKFPLDIVWLDSSKKVIHIEESVSPQSYPDTYCPDNKAQYVLEVNAGQAKMLGIQEGDRAQFKL